MGFRSTVFSSLIVFLTLAATTQVHASRLPDCGQAWSGLVRRGEHRYDGKESYPTYAARLNRKACLKEWTVLVYMQADNDLTPYAYWDLYEMEAGYESGRPYGASTLRSDLVVELDTAGNRGVRRLHVFQSPEPYDPRMGKERFDKMTESDVRSPVVRLLPESRAAEADKFERFLEWGMREYPSKHYMVIVWGHGQGWTSARPDTRISSRFIGPGEALPGIPTPPAQPTGEGTFAERRFGGLAFNETHGTYLDIPSLSSALKRISDRVLGGKPIDVYASDACLMQMLEVATELSSAARFIVGSTQVQNFLGLPYRRLMYELNTGRFGGEKAAMATDDQPYLMARMIPKVFKASMAPGGLQGRFAPEGIKTVTMSSISTAELSGSLLPALEVFSRAMLEYLKEDPLRAMDVQYVLQTAPTFQGGAQEVGAFLGLVQVLLKNEAEATGGQMSRAAEKLSRASGDAKQALHRTAVGYALGTRYSGAEGQLHLLGFKAISVWLPVSERDFGNRIRDFSPSSFYQRLPSWKMWLETLFSG